MSVFMTSFRLISLRVGQAPCLQRLSLLFGSNCVEMSCAENSTLTVKLASITALTVTYLPGSDVSLPDEASDLSAYVLDKFRVCKTVLLLIRLWRNVMC
ncbi:hypothetical protein CEXT_749771 [Caerostris extrusa]|uniref:Uncharacterized protein n=1 Tax=Caerostris extrusa TaxID=172846 RepID=A0AAV4UKA7_CAEEX|nr:hypothetical protein CEXT_749771 [Caerostris extrusa]